MQEGSIPIIDDVYEKYKKFVGRDSRFQDIGKALSDLFKYSNFYVRISLLKEEDSDLLEKFKEISALKYDVTYPFLIAVYADYEDKAISKKEFIEIIDLVLSYVVRRAICEIPNNSLNKTFSALHKRINRENYLESLQAEFLLMDSYRRFPSDSEFLNALKFKDIYNFRSKNYLLESLENWGRKEVVNVENFSIEHILPQNKDLSVQWKRELGEDWENTQQKYLHTLGNLTLTGYNSELSDRSFSEKKTIPGGFNTSPLFLNESVREEGRWDENAILKRAALLADRACQIWTRPTLSPDIIQKYDKSDKDSIYDLSSYEHLKGEMVDLYQVFKRRVLCLDSSIKIEFKKLYIAFKAQTNFVDVVPQKKRLRLVLNIKFDEINDPKGICKDVSKLGRWGNGDVEVSLSSMSEIDAVIELVKQSLEQQVEIV